ncbi:transposase [Myxococcota bacterium]
MAQRDRVKRKQNRQRRKHSAEYKAEVVRLCQESRKSPEVIGREMGLSGGLVRAWLKQADVDAGGGGEGALTTPEREELGQLRREVKHLRQERDILKKATAFFVKEATS